MTSAKPVRELRIVRTFDAPRAQVWKLWTDAAHVARWWGPRGFTSAVRAWEARPGGRIDVTMRASDGIAPTVGRDHPMTGEFLEVLEPERLVFTAAAFFDADGAPRLVNRNTITLEERDGKTVMTLHVAVIHAGPGTEQALRGTDQGWNESIDRLGEQLERS